MISICEQKQSTLLDEAIKYYSLGMSIIPVLRASKIARIPWSPYQSTRADENQLRQWFCNTQTNLAVVLGDVSGGLTCCDFDSYNSYTEWAKEFPDLADMLPTAKTSRGLHVYFRSGMSKTVRYEGISVDLKGSGYMLLPPSSHETGAIYTWVNPMKPVNELPLLDPSQWFSLEFTQDTQENQETQDTQDIQETQAIEINIQLNDMIEKAIKETLPDDEGQRNQCIFQFCRKLKAIPELSKAGTGMLRQIVQQWHSKALPTISTKDFTATWADFTYGWDKVRYPEGETLLRAMKLADENQKEPQVQYDYDCEKTRFLIRLCYQLQQLRCDKSMFFIGCRDAGKCSGFSHTEAAKRLKMLVADSVLVILKENTRENATEYRFIKEYSNQ